MIIRKALKNDLARCLEIYEIARNKMRENGNPTQWGTEYPYDYLIKEDIELGRLYVVDNDGSVEGVFLMEQGPDETYLEIEGEWLNDKPYYVIHRIASSGRVKGVLKAAVDYTKQFCDNIRIDTHEKNIAMQNALSRLEFKPCGTIYVYAPWEGKSPRIGYHFCK
jgi:hypothetical protein